MKTSRYIIRFTSEKDNDNVIYKLIVESENEKFALKRFEKKFIGCSILCITKMWGRLTWEKHLK